MPLLKPALRYCRTVSVGLVEVKSMMKLLLVRSSVAAGAAGVPAMPSDCTLLVPTEVPSARICTVPALIVKLPAERMFLAFNTPAPDLVSVRPLATDRDVTVSDELAGVI